MKQQEILKKIGNILKELNEQYEYLQAEDAHINDLELELFAANAKFLTDHNEILRKVNAQFHNAIPALPEHTETNTEEANDFGELNETILPPLAESAVTYGIEPEPEATNDQFNQQTQPEAYSYNEPEQSYDQNISEAEQAVTEQYHEPEQTFSFEQSPEVEPVQEQSVTETEAEPQHTISLKAAHDHDSFNFVRTEPQPHEEQDTFELSSSYTEDEITPPHVDITPAEPEQKDVDIDQAQPVAETYESILAKYGQPFNTPAEIEDITPLAANEEQSTLNQETHEPVKHEDEYYVAEPATPEAEPSSTFAEPEVTPHVEEEKPVFTHEAYEPPAEEHKTFQTYTPPVTTEAPKLEPEHPLSLHERLAAQLRGHDATPAPQPQQQQQQPITDIKSAINLNDRMLYVKDLFNGYGMAYNEAIELLNRYRSFEEADKFLKMNYLTKNHWEEKPTTVDKFYAVLRRRFPQ